MWILYSRFYIVHVRDRVHEKIPHRYVLLITPYNDQIGKSDLISQISADFLFLRCVVHIIFLLVSYEYYYISFPICNHLRCRNFEYNKTVAFFLHFKTNIVNRSRVIRSWVANNRSRPVWCNLRSSRNYWKYGVCWSNAGWTRRMLRK